MNVKETSPVKSFVFNIDLFTDYLIQEIPPQILANVLDHVLYEYAILTIRHEAEAQDNRMAANSISTLKRLIDVLRDLAVQQQDNIEIIEN